MWMMYFTQNRKTQFWNSNSKDGENVWLVCRKGISIEVLCGLWKDQPLLVSRRTTTIMSLACFWEESKKKARQWSQAVEWTGFLEKDMWRTQVKSPQGKIFWRLARVCGWRYQRASPCTVPLLSLICASQEHPCALVSKEARCLWGPMNTDGVSMPFGLKKKMQLFKLNFLFLFF